MILDVFSSSPKSHTQISKMEFFGYNPKQKKKKDKINNPKLYKLTGMSRGDRYQVTGTGEGGSLVHTFISTAKLPEVINQLGEPIPKATKPSERKGPTRKSVNNAIDKAFGKTEGGISKVKLGKEIRKAIKTGLTPSKAAAVVLRDLKSDTTTKRGKESPAAEDEMEEEAPAKPKRVRKTAAKKTTTAKKVKVEAPAATEEGSEEKTKKEIVTAAESGKTKSEIKKQIGELVDQL